MGQVVDQQQPLQPATVAEVASATSASNPTTTTPKVKPLSARRMRVGEFLTHEVLDPSYVTLPLRATTLEAAAMYALSPSSTAAAAEPSPPTTTTTTVENESSSTTPSQRRRGTCMPGSHKHLGGASDPTDGRIYGVPANARHILCLSPVYDDADQIVDYTISSRPLPAAVAGLKMKWLRGIVVHGQLWAIPSWAPSVLCVDLDAWHGRRRSSSAAAAAEETSTAAVPNNDYSVIQLIELPEEYRLQQQQTCAKAGVDAAVLDAANGHAQAQRPWQWHGAGLNHEKTAIYCIPSNANAVLKVDIMTKTTTLIPITYDATQYPDMDLSLPNKWYGGIVGQDNCVYGIPYRASAVLRIDCNTDTATMVGKNYGVSQYNWHGGIQVNGKIYAHPSHADTVLVIDTRRENYVAADATDGTTLRLPHIFELPIERHDPTDPRKEYKWLGGAVGVDGNIYCPACDTSVALVIDTHTDQCRTFGFCGKERNKWQGGVLGRDGCVYCIPANAKHVLRIATFVTTSTTEEGGIERPAPVVQLIGDLPPHKDKWQGGSMGKDGSLYFMPENGYRVLKVTPPPERPVLQSNGQLPVGDVLVEFV